MRATIWLKVIYCSCWAKWVITCKLWRVQFRDKQTNLVHLTRATMKWCEILRECYWYTIQYLCHDAKIARDIGIDIYIANTYARSHFTRGTSGESRKRPNILCADTKYRLANTRGCDGVHLSRCMAQKISRDCWESNKKGAWPETYQETVGNQTRKDRSPHVCL